MLLDLRITAAKKRGESRVSLRVRCQCSRNCFCCCLCTNDEYSRESSRSWLSFFFSFGKAAERVGNYRGQPEYVIGGLGLDKTATLFVSRVSERRAIQGRRVCSSSEINDPSEALKSATDGAPHSILPHISHSPPVPCHEMRARTRCEPSLLIQAAPRNSPDSPMNAQ